MKTRNSHAVDGLVKASDTLSEMYTKMDFANGALHKLQSEVERYRRRCHEIVTLQIRNKMENKRKRMSFVRWLKVVDRAGFIRRIFRHLDHTLALMAKFIAGNRLSKTKFYDKKKNLRRLIFCMRRRAASKSFQTEMQAIARTVFIYCGTVCTLRQGT